jgi:hypothetical protein
MNVLFDKNRNSYLFNEFVCNFGFFWHEWTSPRVPKKAQITLERVEYNVFLFDESLKGSKSLKIFKISLTFRFDKLSNLSKFVHTVENSQILTVSNKKNVLCKQKSFDNNFGNNYPDFFRSIFQRALEISCCENEHTCHKNCCLITFFMTLVTV